jgi:general secretion pathway protein L
VVVGHGVTEFWQWWTAELRASLPLGAAGGRRRTPPRRILLTPGVNAVGAWIEERGRATPLPLQWPGETAELEDLATALAGLPRAERRLPIGIRVDPQDCHQRTVELPAAAQRDFPRLLALDLERATPLRMADVMSAHMVEGAGRAKGLVRVRHLLVKRRTVEPTMREIRAAGLEPSFVESWDSERAGALPVDFLQPAASEGDEASRSRPRMAAAAVLALVLGAGSAHWWQKETELSALSAQVSRLEAGAREGRQALAQARAADEELARLVRMLDARPPATLIVEEVTRLVPDTAWLEELHIEGDGVEIAGLATSASNLLQIFERSAMFHETRFTAPLRLESGSDRERFRLRTRLKPGAQVR